MDASKLIDSNQTDQSGSFEATRFQYCKELFERERLRKDSLENKAQIILSLVTLILGVIFFNLDFSVLESFKNSPFIRI